MAGGPLELGSLDGGAPKINDLIAWQRGIARDIDQGAGVGTSILGEIGVNAAIAKTSATSVNFRTVGSATPAVMPRIICRHGRVGIVTSDPSDLQITGASGTKYIYADIGATASNNVSLVLSTTAPASETTQFRAPLGQVEWDGAAIDSVIAYHAIPIDNPGVLDSLILGTGSLSEESALLSLRQPSDDDSKRLIDAKYELGDGSSGVAGGYIPISLRAAYNATDLGTGLKFHGYRGRVVFGEGGVGAIGSTHNQTLQTFVQGVGSADSEHAVSFGSLVYEIGTGFTQTSGPVGESWFTDWGVHGPIAVQPKLLNGITMFVNNHYNGTPSSGPSSGMWIVTRKGTGPGATATHNSADTYPVSIGLGILGQSDVGGTPGLGFQWGIRIGGSSGSGWARSGNPTASRIGIGIQIDDWSTRGIVIGAQHAGASATANALELAINNRIVWQGGGAFIQASAATNGPRILLASDAIHLRNSGNTDRVVFDLSAAKLRFHANNDNAGFLRWDATTSGPQIITANSGQVFFRASSGSGDTIIHADGGYMQYREVTDPAAPGANLARLYARDNGAGKTQLVARFNTGAVQVIATEP